MVNTVGAEVPRDMNACITSRSYGGVKIATRPSAWSNCQYLWIVR